MSYTQFVSSQLGFTIGKLATVTSTSGDMNNFAHGKGMIAGRPHDQVGIGYSYTGISNAHIPSLLGFNDGQGIEAYYQLAVTPWCQLSPDVQWISPSNERVTESWVLGLRLNLIF